MIEMNSFFKIQDDPAAMDFVTCAANIRAYIFGIPLKSRFDVKCECIGAIELITKV